MQLFVSVFASTEFIYSQYNTYYLVMQSLNIMRKLRPHSFPMDKEAIQGILTLVYYNVVSIYYTSPPFLPENKLNF